MEFDFYGRPGSNDPALRRLHTELEAWINSSDERMNNFTFNLNGMPGRIDELDIFSWNFTFNAKEDSLYWKGQLFVVKLTFPSDYPVTPPVCRIVFPKIMHINVTTSGIVTFPLVDKDRDWKPEYDMITILMELRDLLDKPSIAEKDRLLISFMVDDKVYPLWEPRK